jgi:hypothetical protein
LEQVSDFCLEPTGTLIIDRFLAANIEGPTAYRTNPCEVGDFALVSNGQGAVYDWSGHCLGDPGFSEFEQYAVLCEREICSM